MIAHSRQCSCLRSAALFCHAHADRFSPAHVIPLVSATLGERGGSVCLNRLSALISGLSLVNHAAASSGWSKYIWSGV